MRPTGPVPLTCRRSMPASLARRRMAGDASGFSPSGRGAPETDGRSVLFGMTRDDAGFAFASPAFGDTFGVDGAASGFGVASFAGGSALTASSAGRLSGFTLPSPATFRR